MKKTYKIKCEHCGKHLANLEIDALYGTAPLMTCGEDAAPFCAEKKRAAFEKAMAPEVKP